MSNVPPVISETEYTIICPRCGVVQVATAVLYEGSTWYAYVHECIGCKYVIMESEWQEATDEQVELFRLRHVVRLLTDVAQEAWQLPIDVNAHRPFAEAMARALNQGAFRPGGDRDQ